MVLEFYNWKYYNNAITSETTDKKINNVKVVFKF